MALQYRGGARGAREAISANAHDPRIADTSIKYYRDHCKFGKAQNLEARKRNYRKTFGEQNVNFFCIVDVVPNDVDRAERLVSDRLGRHRAEGPLGRVTEWMHGIEPTEVVRITLSVLQEHNINFIKLC